MEKKSPARERILFIQFISNLIQSLVANEQKKKIGWTLILFFIKCKRVGIGGQILADVLRGLSSIPSDVTMDSISSFYYLLLSSSLEFGRALELLISTLLARRSLAILIQHNWFAQKVFNSC